MGPSCQYLASGGTENLRVEEGRKREAQTRKLSDDQPCVFRPTLQIREWRGEPPGRRPEQCRRHLSAAVEGSVAEHRRPVGSRYQRPSTQLDPPLLASTFRPQTKREGPSNFSTQTLGQSYCWEEIFRLALR